MPFKVKATLVAFIGDEEKYPCHFQYQIGDEIIYDGEKYIGRVCPAILGVLGQNKDRMYELGLRATGPGHYFPFWYAPPSVKDPSKKQLDGLGFSSVFRTHVEPQYNMANLVPPNAYQWPPYKGPVGKEITLMCPDLRTAALFRIEAIDLADKGFIVPFFRRQMAIMNKVLRKQGIQIEKILEEFSENEKLQAYPPLSEEIIPPLLEDLTLLSFVEIIEEKAFVTQKGAERLKEFKATLTEEEIKLLDM